MLKIQQKERKLKMFKFEKILMVSLILSLASFSNVLAQENLKTAEKKEQNVAVLNSEPSEKLDDNMKVLKNIKYIDFTNAEKEMPIAKEKAEQRVKQNMNLIYCCVNPFFKDRKDMSNFFAKSLFLNYVYDELIKELKKDKELEEYLNKKNELMDEWLSEGVTNEQVIKISLNYALLSDRLNNKNSGDFFRILLKAPSKMMQKIDYVFKSSERMKNIFNEKNFSDEKFEEIKNNAVLFLEKEKLRIEEKLKNAADACEKKKKAKFKRVVYWVVRECYKVRTIESFKEARLKELKYLEEKVAEISNKLIQGMLNERIESIKGTINTEENLRKSYEEEKSGVDFNLKYVFENLANDCLELQKTIAKDVAFEKQAAKQQIEIINYNIKAVWNISKSDFEKVLSEVATEKTNELLEIPYPI